ncbi:MAG: hypothetical protein U9Q34_04420 [Elusimicrobiota bacterium]|nr:hypothetical protein [Elusimicrobiota bacterium]
MEIQKKTKSYTHTNEEFVEAEIVDDGKRSSRNRNTSGNRTYGGERNQRRQTHSQKTRLNPEKAFSSMKYRIMGLLLVAGIVLTLFGFVLTSTIIGAIIGIPLMILGISLLSLFGKLLFSKKNPAIFKTYRF